MGRETLRVAVLQDTAHPGLGGHGTHLAFRGLPGIEMVALADSGADGTDADRLAETGAARLYRDWREMLEREHPDIAVLCSRLPGDHLEPIRMAARLGIHIFCEKPLASDLRTADEIVALSERHRIRIAVAHLARYSLAFRTMKRMIERGEIGRMLTFYGRGKEDQRGGGEDLLVLGTHILDLGNFLFGEPESVFAEIRQEGRPLRRGDRLPTAEPVGAVAGDDVWMLFRYPGEVRGVFESRRGLAAGRVRMGVTVAGSCGALAVRYDDERALRIRRGAVPPEDGGEEGFETVPLTEERTIPGAAPLPADDSGMWRYFHENNRFAAWDLAEAVRNGREPVASARDARRVLELIQGAYLSQLTGRTVPLPLEKRVHPLEEI